MAQIIIVVAGLMFMLGGVFGTNITYCLYAKDPVAFRAPAYETARCFLKTDEGCQDFVEYVRTNKRARE